MASYEELLDEPKLGHALFSALKDEDIESFGEILVAHLEAKVKTREAKAHGLSERTMYEALSAKGNPSLDLMCRRYDTFTCARAIRIYRSLGEEVL